MVGKELDFRKATMMALTLLRQFAPLLHIVEQSVYHRDVNSHNILFAEDGHVDSYNFYLIDFGLAVDSASWRGSDASLLFIRPQAEQSWKTMDIGGDCKYWPTASWRQFMWGWKSLSDDDAFHYRHRLDFHSLGIVCYELMFQVTRLPGEESASLELRKLLAELKEEWDQYWASSTHYWTQLFGTFSGKKDWKSLRDLMRNSVAHAYQSNLQRLRLATSALHKTTFTPQWAHLGPLFHVIHDLIDTRGYLSWKNIEGVLNRRDPPSGTWSSAKHHRRARSDPEHPPDGPTREIVYQPIS